jgi:hypothetical protein
LTGSQTLGGVASADEDILRFDGTSWSLYFDGSDVGLSATDLFGFSMVDADTILMSFSSAVTVNGISVTPRDIMQFDATSLGSVTAGTFSMYLNGIDVGLDATAENIDAVTLLADGQVLISTTGNPAVPGLSGLADEDVLTFTPVTLGNNTSGSWSLYFDGSDVGLSTTSSEDVDALDVVDGKVYLSTLGDFSVTGIAGANDDVFVCTPTSLGSTTACAYSSALYFDGSTWGLDANDVDGINLLVVGPVPTSTPSPTLTLTATPTGIATNTATITPTGTATATETVTSTPTVSVTVTPTHTPPSSMFVQVTDPNGGEILNVGNTHRITWDSTPDIDKVSLGYKSCDSCLDWIATNIPNTGYYDWNVFVGTPLNTQYKIYIIGYDTGTGSISDTSDEYFTVLQPTPTPTYTRTPTPTATPNAVGLVAAYCFNEGTGTTLFDTSGNNNHGILTNGPVWNIGGKYGSAIAFDGVNDRVIVPDANSLDLTTGFTLETWVYPASTMTGWDTVLMKENPSAGSYAYLLYANGDNNLPNGYVNISGDQGVQGSSTLPLNTWSHLAFTYDGAALRLYVNGQLTQSKAQSGSLPVTTGVLSMGGNSIWTSENFPGRIDEVRIYNRSLTLAEIQIDRDTPLACGSATATPSITPTRTLTPSVTPTSTATRTNTPVNTATRTNTPVNTATFTPTETRTNTPISAFTPTTTATRTGTPTLTHTPTATATSGSSGFPSTNVLDTFNRANGAIGPGWSGYNSAFNISSSQLDVVSRGWNTYILWNSSSLGPAQEAYVTLTQIDTGSSNEHSLILKSQSSTTSAGGMIYVMYDGLGHTVQLWTYSSAQGWVQRGADIPVTMVNGDRFGARAKPDGTVEVYRNGVLLGSRDVSGWTYSANGGYIGLWFVNSGNSVVDDFGGGTVTP